MRSIAKTAAAKGITLGVTLLLGGARLGGQVPIGIAIAPPPQARVVPVPPAPQSGFVWIEGYWYPVAGQYRWHDGYWTRPPYDGARWFAPRHDGERYIPGFWYGEHGLIEHDHRWDRISDRDFHHERRALEPRAAERHAAERHTAVRRSPER